MSVKYPLSIPLVMLSVMFNEDRATPFERHSGNRHTQAYTGTHRHTQAHTVTGDRHRHIHRADSQGSLKVSMAQTHTTDRQKTEESGINLLRLTRKGNMNDS